MIQLNLKAEEELSDAAIANLAAGTFVSALGDAASLV